MIESLGDMTGSEIGDASVSSKELSIKTNGKPVLSLNSSILGDVEVTVMATLGYGSLPVSELLQLTSGSVVELGTPLDGHLDLTLNGKLIARGELVAVDDHFGIRISEIIAE
jgi:flagellar motor switch protein FliN